MHNISALIEEHESIKDYYNHISHVFTKINDKLKTNESKEMLDLITQFPEFSSPDIDGISNKIATFIDNMSYQASIYQHQIITGYLFIDRKSLEKYKVIIHKPVKETNLLEHHIVESGGKDTLEIRRRALRKTIKDEQRPYVDLILEVYVSARYIERIADDLVMNRQILLPSDDKISKQLLFMIEQIRFDNSIIFSHPWYNLNTGMYIFEKVTQFKSDMASCLLTLLILNPQKVSQMN